jgi:hypothetical protein
VTQYAIRIDGKTPVHQLIAQAHGRKSRQAGTIRKIRRTTGRPAEPEPVQRRPATGFKVRLVPHTDKLCDPAAESKPRG